MEETAISGADEKMRAVLERVAQQIVYCNCATEGPALKRCEHISLAAQLERRLLPLLLAGQAMREFYDPCPDEEMPDRVIVAWDAALAAAQGQPEKESGR